MGIVISKADIDKEKQIKKMFDSISFRYDFLNKLLSLKRDFYWRRKLVSFLDSKPGGIYLDVATGTGDVLFEAVKTNKYKKYIGVDISEGMLEIAKDKAKNLVQDITWTCMSAHKLAIDDTSVDAVSISFGIRNVSNKPAAISEFSRVLKQHGQLCIMEFFIPPKGILGKVFLFYFKEILPKIGSIFSSKSAYSYLPESVANFYSYDDFVKLLRKESFQLIFEKSYLFGCCRLLHLRKK
jgi:demethylmenaquinone methyltransferase / 2-methoxy-6-polyprenyl-1,4-benzoquinol methylase